MIGHLIGHTDHQINGWIARVVEINDNDMKVVISSDQGGQWEETWNLEHTQAGLRNGEYYILGKCND